MKYSVIICVISYVASANTNIEDNQIADPKTDDKESIINQILEKKITLDGHAPFPIPYMVSVQAINKTTRDFQHLCGGTIIHEEFVLTAAHCFSEHPHNVTVVGGSNTLSLDPSDPSDRRVVVQRIQHEYYQPLMGRDVALLRVKPKFVFDGKRYDKINFNVDEPVQGRVNGYLIGWGRKSHTNSKLEMISFLTIDSKSCRKRGFTYVSSTEVCAISHHGRGACDGDSGGPLVDAKLNLQIGLLSYGRGVCQPNHIYAFTHLNPLRGWLLTRMNLMLKRGKA